MRRESFFHLIDLIKDHKVFKKKKRGKTQTPVEYQLMAFLKYVGTEGSGCSNPDLRNVFRAGRGTFEDYKDRVVTAIRSL